MSLTNLCPDYTHTESQVLIHSITIGRILMAVINGSFLACDVVFIYFIFSTALLREFPAPCRWGETCLL